MFSGTPCINALTLLFLAEQAININSKKYIKYYYQKYTGRPRNVFFNPFNKTRPSALGFDKVQ